MHNPVARLCVLVSVIAAGLVIGSARQASAAPTEFAYTGAAQTYDVPDGITKLVVEAYGGEGARGDLLNNPGGLGGYVRAIVPVTPDQILQVNVGGAASNSTAGWNGGGAGSAVFRWGGGGGGASDIRTGTYTLGERLVVAGGGGGSGGRSCCSNAGNGGNGGHPNGADGEGTAGNIVGEGGKGGTQTAGGEGGAGGDDEVDGSPGDDGTLGTGGKGGDGPGSGGGGGGGGYYGGGGGGGGASDPPSLGFRAGGGGGGSSFGPEGSTFTNGVRSGNGLVRITVYQPDAQINLPGQPAIGDGIYDDGSTQVVKKTARRKATYELAFGNDGDVEEQFTVTGCAPAGTKVTVMEGPSDVTAEVLTGKQVTLIPGAKYNLVLTLSAKRGKKTCVVSVTSNTTSASDAVTAILKIRS